MSNLRVGNIVTGTVIVVEDNLAYIGVGGKSEGRMYLEYFTSNKEVKSLKGILKEGDQIRVQVSKITDGLILLSRLEMEEKERRDKVVRKVMNKKPFTAKVTGKNKNNEYLLDKDGVNVILPENYVDLDPEFDKDSIIGTEQRVVFVKSDTDDRGRTRLIVSRKQIQYNEEMCFLEDSNCGSSLEGSDKNKITQCSQQQIEIANNNNNYEDVVENETSDDNSSSNSSSNRSGFSSFNYNEGSDKSDKSGFLKTFLIVVSVGIVIVAVVFFVIYKMGNKKPKFSRFDDDNHHNRSENEIEIINNNNNVARTATVATNAATVVSGSTSPPPITYSYNYARSSVSVQAQVPSTIGGYSVYYPVPSPVPPAAQTSTYIPPSPTASYAIPVSQPEVAYLSPIQSSQHVSYVPSNVSTYASPQPENANLPTDVQSGVAQTEKDYPLPPLVGQEGLPNDVLPPYESLGRSLRHPQ